MQNVQLAIDSKYYLPSMSMLTVSAGLTRLISVVYDSKAKAAFSKDSRSVLPSKYQIIM